jgi:GWxTD domain-containing protein
MFHNVLRPVLLVGVALLATSVFAQDKLSGNDQRWMEKEVAPLITANEMAIFQQISKDDRELFKELFWMRRDLDPLTPENEFREMYEKGIETADDNFGSGRTKGSESDFGKVFLVLGNPSDEQRGGSGGSETVTWTYEPNPALGIPDGLSVRFRQQAQFGYRMVDDDGVREALERAKESHIANRDIDYARDDKGRLLKPGEGSDAAASPMQILKGLIDTGATSDAIPFDVKPAYFQASGGEIYVPMDIVMGQGFSGSQATIFYELRDQNGESKGRFQQTVALSKGARGHLGYELPIQVQPGAYKLYIGVLDDSSKSYGAKVVDIEAPNFGDGVFKLSSIVMFSDAQQTGDANGEPGKAFLLGGYHFFPKREMVYTHDDHLAGVLSAYNFGLSGGKPNLTVQVSFFKDGQPRGKTKEEPFMAQSPEMALTIFDLPLNIPNFDEPGNYKLEVKVTDQTNEKTLTEEVPFAIE